MYAVVYVYMCIYVIYIVMMMIMMIMMIMRVRNPIRTHYYSSSVTYLFSDCYSKSHPHKVTLRVLVNGGIDGGGLTEEPSSQSESAGGTFESSSSSLIFRK